MTTKPRGRFDVRALRKLAGEKTFARGEAYKRGELVAIIDHSQKRVVAQVAGTDDYRTELTGRGKAIHGNCTCPAFADHGFCKHMVATALAANAAAESGESADGGALARVRRHLKAKGIDALVDMIVDLAERDTALFQRLDVSAAAEGTDDAALEARLRKAIDRATSTRDFIDYREAADWAGNVGSALDVLAGLTSGDRAHIALELSERAVSRIEKAIESIDDSDGHCGGLLERVRDIHLAACRTARPDPIGLARSLFARETDGDYDTFRGAAALYADALGENGLAEYRRLATEALKRSAPHSARAGQRPERSFRGHRLEGILDFFAERDGDVEARIALRRQDLSSTWAYLRLAEFCRSQGRKEEALRYAEEGLWQFEDERPDERLVFFAVDLLVGAGRKEDAEAQLWRAFEKAPSLELHARLRKLGGKRARDRAVALLEKRVGKEEHTRWHYPADLLIRVLMHDKMFDAAWTAVRQHGASMGVREALARASEATHAPNAVEVYAERIEELAGSGGSAYAQAAELVKRMAGLLGAAEQAAYVASLKERHRRKRNFMKLLA